MQFCIEDGMLLALDVIDAELARKQFDRDAITDAERRVLERVGAERVQR